MFLKPLKDIIAFTENGYNHSSWYCFLGLYFSRAVGISPYPFVAKREEGKKKKERLFRLRCYVHKRGGKKEIFVLSVAERRGSRLHLFGFWNFMLYPLDLVFTNSNNVKLWTRDFFFLTFYRGETFGIFSKAWTEGGFKFLLKWLKKQGKSLMNSRGF